jgi:hypothetical protein
MFQQISTRIRLPRNFRDILHAANLRHGTDFTSPPNEGVLRIFFALKNPTASAGFEPANSRPPKPLIWLYYIFFILSHKRQDFRGGEKHTVCYDFTYIETSLVITTIQRDMITNVYRSSCKVPVIARFYGT